jgi:hypothetical protein
MGSGKPQLLWFTRGFRYLYLSACSHQFVHEALPNVFGQ